MRACRFLRLSSLPPQIRISLLHSLYNAIKTGEFQANIENVREECRDRKCYNGANFAANLLEITCNTFPVKRIDLGILNEFILLVNF